MAKEFNLKNFIVATLRRATYRFKPRYQTLNEARVERGKYRCKKCELVVGRKDIKADHIEPIVDPKVGFIDWNTYISRMFVDKLGWQALCNTCHKQKTLYERSLRPKKEKSTNKLKKDLTPKKKNVKINK